MKTKTLLLIVTTILLFSCSNSVEQTPKIADTAPTTPPQGEKEKEMVIKKGKEIAGNTFKVLGGNLKKAMGKGGVENAINYCNANASSLMDSISNVYVANIRRTSNKLRNQNNSPTAAEQKVLAHYLDGGEMTPIAAILPNGNKVFYAPIKTKALCLSCHGTIGTSISEKDYTFINKHYPNDKAINYKEGDFRGIWSIELKQ